LFRYFTERQTCKGFLNVNGLNDFRGIILLSAKKLKSVWESSASKISSQTANKLQSFLSEK
jgi:hypothetical protein